MSRRALPLAGAILCSTVVVLSGPFMGLVRARIRAAFPREFVWIVGGSIAAIVAAGIAAAVSRIEDRRLTRIGAIAAALVLGGAYAVIFASGRADVDASSASISSSTAASRCSSIASGSRRRTRRRSRCRFWPR